MEGLVFLKKLFDVICQTSTVFVVIFAILLVLYTVLSTVFPNSTNNNSLPYHFFTVLSDSMSATDFDAGDVICVKSICVNELEVGDIVAYKSKNYDDNKEIITHKIRAINKDNGDIKLVTYGTTTNVDDEDLVEASQIVGKYIFRIPKVGKLSNFVGTTHGYIIMVFVPFAVILCWQAITVYKASRRRAAHENENYSD